MTVPAGWMDQIMPHERIGSDHRVQSLGARTLGSVYWSEVLGIPSVVEDQESESESSNG